MDYFFVYRNEDATLELSDILLRVIEPKDVSITLQEMIADDPKEGSFLHI